MAFENLIAKRDGQSIRVRFDVEQPCVVGYQIYDPDTGAFLFEGEWREVHDCKVDLEVAVPADDGPYRIQVAPVENRERFVLIDARVHEGTHEVETPRVATEARLRRE